MQDSPGIQVDLCRESYASTSIGSSSLWTIQSDGSAAYRVSRRDERDSWRAADVIGGTSRCSRRYFVGASLDDVDRPAISEGPGSDAGA